MKGRSWTKQDLEKSIAISKSIRQVLKHLRLVEAGGNYEQIKKYIKIYNINTSHFTGASWNKGMRGRYMPSISTNDILKENSSFQSYKLKVRLFREGIKSPRCEECDSIFQSLNYTESISYLTE